MTTRSSMVGGYFKGLGQHVGSSWNGFWFAPTDVLNLCVLRIAVGTVAILWQWSFAYDLAAWLGPNGLLSNALTRGVCAMKTATRLLTW